MFQLVFPFAPNWKQLFAEIYLDKQITPASECAQQEMAKNQGQ